MEHGTKGATMKNKLKVHITSDEIDYYKAEIEYKELPNIFKIIKDKVK
jgi:hypothetical protein